MSFFLGVAVSVVDKQFIDWMLCFVCDIIVIRFFPHRDPLFSFHAVADSNREQNLGEDFANRMNSVSSCLRN